VHVLPCRRRQGAVILEIASVDHRAVPLRQPGVPGRLQTFPVRWPALRILGWFFPAPEIARRRNVGEASAVVRRRARAHIAFEHVQRVKGVDEDIPFNHDVAGDDPFARFPPSYRISIVPSFRKVRAPRRNTTAAPCPATLRARRSSGSVVEARV
jgi:hypothetical protein